MQKNNLIIERSQDGVLWGRVNYEGNLIVESAESLEQLEIKMKDLLFDFHEIDKNLIAFDVKYDLRAFFEIHSYLNISAIAKIADINPSLLRHYVAGSKTASEAQVLKLQDAIHKVAKDLMKVKIV